MMCNRQSSIKLTKAYADHGEMILERSNPMSHSLSNVTLLDKTSPTSFYWGPAITLSVHLSVCPQIFVNATVAKVFKVPYPNRVCVDYPSGVGV